MKADHDNAMKKSKLNETRYQQLLKDQKRTGESLEQQILSLEQDKIKLWSFLDESELKIPSSLRQIRYENIRQKTLQDFEKDTMKNTKSQRGGNRLNSTTPAKISSIYSNNHDDSIAEDIAHVDQLILNKVSTIVYNENDLKSKSKTSSHRSNYDDTAYNQNDNLSDEDFSYNRKSSTVKSTNSTNSFHKLNGNDLGVSEAMRMSWARSSGKSSRYSDEIDDDDVDNHGRIDAAITDAHSSRPSNDAIRAIDFRKSDKLDTDANYTKSNTPITRSNTDKKLDPYISIHGGDLRATVTAGNSMKELKSDVKSDLAKTAPFPSSSSRYQDISKEPVISPRTLKNTKTDSQVSKAGSQISTPLPGPSMKASLFLQSDQNQGKDIHKTEQPTTSIVNQENGKRSIDMKAGSTVDSSGQGRTETVTEDGTLIVKYRNGTTKHTYPDGRSIVNFVNGDTKTTDTTTGLVIYFYAQANTTHTTYPDGLQVYEFPNGQVALASTSVQFMSKIHGINSA